MDKSESVIIEAGNVTLEGELAIPAGSKGVVLFAHGSGSSRKSPRNRFVAREIRKSGVGTLLFDLLTHEEELIDDQTRHLRFDIDLLAGRLVDASTWLESARDPMNVGYFGASTGGAAAIAAAAELAGRIGAVVSRGGRPDLAAEALDRIVTPTLLIVGGLDDVVLRLNEEAYQRLRCTKELRIVPGATHLFEEPGSLELVAKFAAEWFRRYLLPEENKNTPGPGR